MSNSPLSTALHLTASCQATGAGAKEQEAINFLEKKLKDGKHQNLTADEAVQRCKACFRNTGSSLIRFFLSPLAPPWSTNLLPPGPPSPPPSLPLQLAISALQGVLSEDMKATEIEVGLVAAKEETAFRTLSVDEIEAHLTAISERD
ncbi:unnamed protein product [Closterium sp. NIES-53]